jgi:L-serine dehydratase
MISIFDLFSIGIGPSSSHTVGPMRAAKRFVERCDVTHLTHITVELFGSLAFTGIGHGTDKAIMLGLAGFEPHSIDPDQIDTLYHKIIDAGEININQQQPIKFNPTLHLLYNKKTLLPRHNNGMWFRAFDAHGHELASTKYYSIGGGFVIDDQEEALPVSSKKIPFPFHNAKELLQLCETHNISIADIIFENEASLLPKQEINDRLLSIFHCMTSCIKRGIKTGGILPGGLQVKRRAQALYKNLTQHNASKSPQSVDSMGWLNVYAIAVNEENAAGGRVVTAPTNGAAGIIPAVLFYYYNFYPNVGDDKIIEFLLTAGAIAILYKKNASISGAEVGCQGEVGVACSMAAGALTAVLGGSLAQIENAAEIGIEHHLGMTCDPVMGLVQIPCIERNAMGAIKAVNAARLALAGDGQHLISLDQAILTMKKTGEDMSNTYKETSQGGLAANFTDC